MVNKADTATVSLWGNTVGAVSWSAEDNYAIFEYEPSFLNRGLDISPLQMGLAQARGGDGLFFPPGLNRDTFLGLPGLLADSLPDKFGNSVIDAWLARQGRSAADFSPVERLCYTGKRGMGALEFTPATISRYDKSVDVDISELVALTQQIMSERMHLNTSLHSESAHAGEAILDILRVGTSAGGARPKAVIAINAQQQVISGQLPPPPGFDSWIIKFDGVSDLELGEPKAYGRIEYGYHLMAKAAGITMSECRLLEEQGRAHFMTRRFDRLGAEKLHMHSLCGIAHFDFNQPGAYSYEQVFAVMRQLRLSKQEAVQQFRRMVFNVIARNQDDHTKNIAFLMDKSGKWKLSPAFDMNYSHNPSGRWTSQHQMSLNGKRDNFVLDDLLAVAQSISLSRPMTVIAQVQNAIKRWPEFARQAGLAERRIEEIRVAQHLKVAGSA